MEKNKSLMSFMSRPPIGTRCLYNPGLDDLAFGSYFVEIIKYIHDMPVCKILEVVEQPPVYVSGHEIGKEMFFVVLIAEPNELLKEII